MGGNEITFNMDDLKKRVTASVVAGFGMLIPQEAFDEMVNKEIKAFFELNEWQVAFENVKTGTYYNDTKEQTKILCTPFRLMVWRELQKILAKKIEEVFKSPEFGSNISWDHEGQKATLSAEMEEILVKMVPRFMAEMLRNTFGSMVQQAKEEVLKSIRPN
jgi:hypothetical protein